jgi:hypothetical protein
MNQDVRDGGMFVKASVAEYKEVKEEENIEGSNTLPAKLETMALIRHPLQKGKSGNGIEEISEEFKIDKELGLMYQAKHTAKEALKQDIDELTSSRDYFEVSNDLLKKLFKIGKLKRKCILNNIISPVKGFFKAGQIGLSIHIFVLLMIYPMIKFSAWILDKTVTPFLVTVSVFNIISWIAMIALLILGFFVWSGRTINYTLMWVKINMTPLSEVTTKIPYGAKLKVLEAKKTKIFEDFVYVTPEFYTEGKRHTINFPSIDPAIVGLTSDKRMYMIVYWDIEKDVAKVVKEIEHFKKYKLHKA